MSEEMSPGQRIRDIRLEKGLRQADVATASGLRVETISRLEKGRWKPSERALRDLADALGVSVEELANK